MLYNGKTIDVFKLTNARGMCVRITNFGARILSVVVPDCQGIMRDVVLGFDEVLDYFPESHLSDFGALVGRYANRICDGQITLNGQRIQLPQNNGKNCLHGGPDGWQYKPFEVVFSNDHQLKLSLISPDGDNRFPGTVQASVIYTLTEDNALEIQYEATTDKPTVINLTNHSYFNLDGTGSSPIYDHQLMLNADSYLPIDETSIPLGPLLSVAHTPMDFRIAKAIGQDIHAEDEQLHRGCGYDHCWVLNTQGDSTLCAARLESHHTGITMDVYTTEPGIQVYTSNFLDGVVGKRGEVYLQRSAVCMETQKFPDSPNQHWPQSNAFLNPGETFRSFTKFKFSAHA